MKSALTVFAAVVVVMAVGALGAPSFKSALASTDGGGAAVVAAAISPQATYELQCSLPACFRTCATSTCVADCSKDHFLQARNMPVDGGVGSFGEQFESASDLYVHVAALGSADPACRLLIVKKNVNSIQIK